MMIDDQIVGAAKEKRARILDRVWILEGGELGEGLLDHILGVRRSCAEGSGYIARKLAQVPAIKLRQRRLAQPGDIGHAYRNTRLVGRVGHEGGPLSLAAPNPGKQEEPAGDAI